jgi:hypothetical protein
MKNKLVVHKLLYLWPSQNTLMTSKLDFFPIVKFRLKREKSGVAKMCVLKCNDF